MGSRSCPAGERKAASAFPPDGAVVAAALGRLKKRSEFLAVAAANGRWSTPGLVLQVRRRTPDSGEPSGDPVRLGFTATKKIGGGFQIGDGQTVGIAAPVIIQFDAPIGDKAAVERALKVTTDPPVEGS